MEELTKNGDLSYTAQRAAGNGLKGQFNRVRIYWNDLRWYKQAKADGIVGGLSVNGETWLDVDDEGLEILRGWEERKVIHIREVVKDER
jgi:hypothetical protein